MITSDELYKLLEENLTIHLSKEFDYGSERIKVEICFDSNKICSDYILTKSWQD